MDVAIWSFHGFELMDSLEYRRDVAGQCHVQGLQTLYGTKISFFPEFKRGHLSNGAADASKITTYRSRVQ